MVKDLGPKLVLPNDKIIIGLLEQKMKDYQERLESTASQSRYQDPAITFSSTTWYKYKIAEKLLKSKEVYTWEFSRTLAEPFNYLNTENYNHAAAIINDYCTTGGKNIIKD